MNYQNDLKEMNAGLNSAVDNGWLERTTNEWLLRTLLAIAERLEAIAGELEQSNRDAGFRETVDLYKG